VSTQQLQPVADLKGMPGRGQAIFLSSRLGMGPILTVAIARDIARWHRTSHLRTQ
jgi:hypothetical protein